MSKSRKFDHLDRARPDLLFPLWLFFRGAISVLAAPRYDYVSESVTRRKAREQKIAEAQALQVAFRKDPTASPSPHSSSSLSSSPSPFLQSDPSISNPLQAPHLSSYLYHGQPSSSPSFDAPSSSTVAGGGFSFDDFLQSAGGQGDAISGSVDFLTVGTDPLMVRFIFLLALVSCLSFCQLTLVPSSRFDALFQTLFPGFSQPPPAKQHEQHHPQPSYSTGLESRPPNLNPNAVLPDFRLASPGTWAGTTGDGGVSQAFGGSGSWQESQGGSGRGGGPSFSP